MMTKNERLKQANIDKISLFLSKKYNKVFKDKEFTMDILKYEVAKLLLGKDMKTFNFNDNIRKIEKAILKKVTNYGKIKFEPIQMNKINNLISSNKPNPQQQIQNSKKMDNIPVQKEIKIRAPKSAGSRTDSQKPQKRGQSAAAPQKNQKININNNINSNNNNNNNNNNYKKKNNEIPYPTVKMEMLRERQRNKWAIQANKEHEEYLKEQEIIRRSNYEKKLRQREILEQQIKEKREQEQKIKEEEKGQPSLTSLNLGGNSNTATQHNNQNEKIKRPLSSKPFNNRKKEEIEYQKKVEEDIKKFQEEEKLKKKTMREKYKEIQKENYENALKKKEKQIHEKEMEKKEKNDMNMFNGEENRNMMKMKRMNTADLSRINQNIKHQIAINNYEEQKYKKEREQEQKKFFDEELLQKEKKQKMISDFRKGLDEQLKEKQKMKELKNKVKIEETKDNWNIKNQIEEEKNNKKKLKYEKISNYKKELDEQIEKNKKLKQNELD